MHTFDGLIHTLQDWLAVAVFTLFAGVLGPLIIRSGRQVLAGWRPKRASYQYRRALLNMNLLNLLRGVPEQNEMYEWQWQLFGRWWLIYGALLVAWVPFGLYLLLR